MDTRKTFTVKIDPNAWRNVLSLHYYSETWDVIDFRGDDDDSHALVAASFVEHEHAQEYARTHGGYMLVRPPSDAYAAGVAWLQFVTSAAQSEGTELQTYGALR